MDDIGLPVKLSALLIIAVTVASFSTGSASAYGLFLWEQHMNDGARLAAQKEPVKAEASFKTALLDAGKLPSPGKEAKQIISLMCLGALYQTTGNYSAAEDSFKRVSVLDKEDSESLTSLEKLYTKLGRSAEAEKMKSLAAERDKLYSHIDYSHFLETLHHTITQHWHPIRGRDRCAVARFILSNKGEIEALCIGESSGDQETDEAAFRAVVDAAPFTLPKGSPKQLPILFTFHYNVEKPQAFLDAEEKRLAKQLATMDPQMNANNPSRAWYMCQLGDAYRANKKLMDAEQMYMEALQIVKTNSKASSVNMAVLIRLVGLCADSGRKAEAVKYITESAEVADNLQNDTPDPEQTAKIFHSYGKLLYQINRTADGDAMFARERKLLDKRKTFK